MQYKITSVKRGQTIILHSVTQMKKDVVYLKCIFNKQIDAVLMDIETGDKKTEELKII